MHLSEYLALSVIIIDSTAILVNVNQIKPLAGGLAYLKSLWFFLE